MPKAEASFTHSKRFATFGRTFIFPMLRFVGVALANEALNLRLAFFNSRCMMPSVERLFACLLLCGAVALSGCTWSSSASLEEEKEPHFLEGKARVNTMDYSGAIESFEQALEANPKSAAAHFELGCLYDQRDADPAAAIYHYRRYLKLRPRGDKTNRARERITGCQQQLAKAVSFGPITQSLQREEEAMTEELKKLREQNKVLQTRLEQYEAAANNRPVLVHNENATSASGNSASAVPTVVSPSARENSNGRLPSSNGHTHTVTPGETPVAIA